AEDGSRLLQEVDCGGNRHGAELWQARGVSVRVNGYLDGGVRRALAPLAALVAVFPAAAAAAPPRAPTLSPGWEMRSQAAAPAPDQPAPPLEGDPEDAPSEEGGGTGGEAT